MGQFIILVKKLLGIGTPTLNDVNQHLKNADAAKAEHIYHLLTAADAITEHNTAERAKIDGLAAAIGTSQSKIATANDQLATVHAALAAVA